MHEGCGDGRPACRSSLCSLDGEAVLTPSPRDSLESTPLHAAAQWPLLDGTGLFWAIRGGGHIQATTEFLSRGAKMASYDRDEIPRGAREVALLDKGAPLSNHDAQGTALPTASQSVEDVSA